LSGGRVGWAVAASTNPKLMERRAETIEAARALTRTPLPDRMDLAEKLSEAFKRDREPVMRTLEAWQAWWRDVMLLQSDAGDAVANVDMLAEAQEDAAGFSRAEVARFLQALLETRESLAANVQSKIALEALMLDVPGTPSAARR
jgi:DNA polymerase-3 subunit delta'